jgi:amino acid adenylation domain-containing protein
MTNLRSSGLSPAKRALLELRLKKRQAAGPEADLILRRPSADAAPLSFAQELLWLHDKLLVDKTAYNSPAVRRMSGPLDVAALRCAIDGIAARHEVLRTTFALVGGDPIQRVQPPDPVPLPMLDLQHLPEADRKPEALRLLQKEIRKPFDLSRDRPFRAYLARLATDEHILLLLLHHIASDGWSKAVLWEELAALYVGFVTGTPPSVPELPIQYADFAAWQRQWFQGAVLDRQLAYWKRQLAGAPPALELPADHVRPAVQTLRGAHERRRMSRQLMDGLKTLSQREGVTMFMTLLASFQAILYRFTGQADLVLGTPIAGRNRPETERLVGYFTNTLVLRTDLSGDPTFRELLSRVRRTALDAFDHQDLPFEKLVEELNPQRDLSRSPLFQVMFVYQDPAAPAMRLHGLTISQIMLERGNAKFDLGLSVNETPEGLEESCEYCTDLFETATIRRFLDHFQVLLEGVVADSGCRLSELPLLTQSERHQLLVEWNATDADFPRDLCAHHLIEAQVRRTPDAPAVRSGSEQLTYRELDERANRLAHYLQRRGVGPESLVGVVLERAPEVAVALLGILKAGGAYVPLDPAYPKDRLAFLIADARLPLLLTQERLRSQLPTCSAEVIALDADWEVIASQPAIDPACATRPDNLAYAIYTSGSTGTPKGVLVPHAALVNHMLAAAKEYGLSARDRVLQFSSLSFDISIEEMFPAWAVGATVVQRPPDLPLSGLPLLRWLGKESITVLDLPTAFWHEWVRDLADNSGPLPKSLRLVIVGGEKVSAAAYQTWAKLTAGRVRWVNTYGPTEATVIATLYEPGKAAGHCPGDEIPIGRPIANTQVYIVDGALRPVPIGVPGELLIGGVGVARGYLDHTELTAEKFVHDPYSSRPGARLFRTGDRARYLPDGNIEFLGREDQQVKIRGFRVEPGEVESALALHPDVREVVVVARDNGSDGQRLIGYVVLRTGQVNDEQTIRAFLKEKLPEYMVPAALVFLDALPLTPGGKVDRAALPDVAPVRDRRMGPQPPHNETEKRLVALWEELLGVRPIGISDNFFDLGGHSLLAVRLFARITREFDKELPLSTLFQGGTIEHLARVLTEIGDSIPWATLQEIQPHGSGRPLFVVSSPNANCLGYAMLARHLGPEQPVYGLQSRYRKDLERPYSQAEYEALAAEYLRAMQTIQPHGPYLLAGMCVGSYIALELARQLEAKGEEVPLLAVLDTWTIENTMNRLWHVHNVIHCLRVLHRAGWRGQLRFLQEKGRALLSAARRALTPRSQPIVTKGNPFSAGYWPGPGFEPPRFGGRITLFRAPRQPYYRVRDPQMGWAARAGEGVEVHPIPGAHRTLLREPHVTILAGLLRESILQVQEHFEPVATHSS